MRKECKIENNEIKTIRGSMSGYHHGHFEDGYKVFNSDRAIPIGNFFTMPNGEAIKGYGTEMEVGTTQFRDQRGNVNQNTLAIVLQQIVFDKVFPQKGLFKIESDCTVDAECITQIMTKAFIRNNYHRFNQLFSEEFPKLGIMPDSRCGQHINVSNANFGKTREAQLLGVRKLGAFINDNYDFCVTLFHRDRDRTRWCGRMRTNWETCDVNCFPSDHGNSYNASHFNEGRVEIRLVGAHQTFPSFRNTWEVVFWLVPMIAKVPWSDIHNGNMTRIFNGCNQYVLQRLLDCKRRGYLSDEAYEEIKSNVVQADF